MRTINLLDPAVRANPYPHYAAIRSEAAVCRVDPGEMWAVVRHAEAAYVLREAGLFSSSGLRLLTEHPALEYNPMAESIFVSDPPVHTKLRSLVSRAFGPAIIRRVEPIARRLADRAVATLREGRFVDFCELLSEPLPAAVIAELLGLPPALSGQCRRWAEAFLSINPFAPPEVIARVRDTIETVERHVTELLEARRRAPGDDLVSDLLATEIDGAALTPRELISFFVALLTAGYETTSHLLSSAMRLLVRNPDVHDAVRTDPTLLAAFIDETLRLEAPTQLTLRIATTEAEVGGVVLPAGARVVVLIGSANRDPLKFIDPDRIDLRRPRPGVLSFGHGIHTCIGAALARSEARIALEALLALPGHFEERDASEDWNPSLLVRGLRTYPLRYVE